VGVDWSRSVGMESLAKPWGATTNCLKRTGKSMWGKTIRVDHVTKCGASKITF
jgi:hypothetical protein